MFQPYTDDDGHEHRACHVCGADCSTRPDAGNPLDSCGDCGKATCPDHREESMAARCTPCAARKAADDFDAATTCVLNRMDDGESLEDAAEAVYGDFGGVEYRARLIAAMRGELV